jgi:MFS family permease
MAYLTAFHPALLVVATLIHIVASVLVGLLYGVMLPMFPRRPIILGGFIAPLMWTGLLYTSLGVINPLMDELIDWKWFVASQIGFGIVAGLVVVRQERVRTRQFLPFAVRAGIEAPGIMKEKGGSDKR